MIKYWLRLTLFIVLSSALNGKLSYAQQTANHQIITQYENIRSAMPREKLYAHLDRTVYAPLDTIWFKTYLVDASLNSYSLQSGLVYVEMVNAVGEAVETIALPSTLGLSWGGLALKESLYPPGDYTFRAYTNWMQNFGQTYFFKKEIKIVAIGEPQLANQDTKPNAQRVPKPKPVSSAKALEDDIQFLPEGGSWIAGKQQKMAFKAIHASGKGVAIQGEILDSKQNKIVEFKSNDKGMGYLIMTPKFEEVYTAHIKSTTGTKNIILPKAVQTGTTLKVEQQFLTDSIQITTTTDLLDQELTVIGTSRGLICFITKLKSKSKTFSVAKNIFPTGVCQILLLNKQNQALNERSFFVNLQNDLKIQTSASALTYRLRDSIPIQLNITDVNGAPVVGSFSMAVTADNQVLKDPINNSNILSYFLMSTDLKGEIENPGYYFYEANAQTHEDLDALMLTQGWVSYNWDLSKKPAFKVEKEYIISGKVTNILNKPAAKAKITLLGNNKSLMLLDTIANQNGEFVFNHLPMLDSAYFAIQALNANGKKGTLGIQVNEFKRPLFTINTSNNFLLNEKAPDSTVRHFIAVKKQEYQSLNGGILLRAVEIMGKKIIPKSNNLNGPGEADQTIAENDLIKVARKSLLNILEEKVKGFGLRTSKDGRSKTFAIDFDRIKLIIDGIDVDVFYVPTEGGSSQDEYYYFIKNYLDYYIAEDITGIEIMRSRRMSSSYTFKFVPPLSTTNYAFIEVTTKTGSGPFLIKRAANMYLFRPLTYGNNKLFYSPSYTAANKADLKPDLRPTLFWAPNILTNGQGKAKVSFFSADQKGSYTVWIEGTDTQGNFGMKTMKFIIK